MVAKASAMCGWIWDFARMINYLLVNVIPYAHAALINGKINTVTVSTLMHIKL